MRSKEHQYPENWDDIRFISVYGKMRSGKDAASNFLKHIGPYRQISYGGKLKDFYHRIFGYNEELAKDRDGYQWFGQAMRGRYPNVWVDHLDERIKLIQSNAQRFGIIVSDMRQPNEFEHLKSRGFVMVKIDASDETRRARIEQAGEIVTEEMLNHETEQSIDSFDYDFVIDNNGSLTNLHEQITKLVSTDIPNMKRGDQ